MRVKWPGAAEEWCVITNEKVDEFFGEEEALVRHKVLRTWIGAIDQ